MKPLRRKRVVFDHEPAKVTGDFARLAVSMHERAAVTGHAEPLTTLERLTPRACSCDAMAVRLLDTDEQRHALLAEGLRDVELAAGALAIRGGPHAELFELVSRVAHELNFHHDAGPQRLDNAVKVLGKLVPSLERPTRRRLKEQGIDGSAWDLVWREGAARTRETRPPIPG